MNTIRIYLTESGRIADLQKDFPLYQGQFQNKLLNVFVPTSILAPIFTSSGAVSADYVASTSTKIGMTYTARDGSIKTSKNYYMRYLKTLMYKGVEYALYERKLPKEFTFYAGQGENSPVLIINVVNIEQQSGDTPPLVLSVITSQTCHLDVMQSTFLDRDELDEPSELENLNAQVQALNALMPKKQDKEDENIALEQAPAEKTVVGAINKLGGLVKTAQSSADTAQQTAETAQTTADNATTLANNAVATANGAVATANEAKTTAQTAENNANSAVDTANAANATADEAKAIAQGSQRAIGFATLQSAITALNGYSNTQLKVGDNVYIVETGVPDLWVAAVEQNSVAYNYTTNDAFNDDLVENTLVQVGYYKFAYLESDGKPCTVAWQNMTVAASDWVASTEFADFAYEAKIALSDFVNFSSIPQVVFGLTEATSGNYAPICKAGDKGVYIYSKVNTAITLPTVVTFAPNVHGASMQGGGYTNKGKWVASTTYAIDDLVYTDNGQFVCIEGITSTTSPEQDTQHWQATFVATGKTKNALKFSGQDNGTGVQKTFNGSTPVEVAFDENTMTAKEVNGVLKVGAKGTVPEALPQEAGALKSGNLPTTGWTSVDAPLWTGSQGNSYGETKLFNLGVTWESQAAMPLTGWTYSYYHDVSQTHTNTGTWSRNSGGITSFLDDYFAIKIMPNGDVYFWTGTYNLGANWYILTEITQTTLSKQGYTISDTDITANSDVLMELTDNGGVKAHALANGSIQVIRNSVPTSPIPYTYKVKQTNASGQFTLVNHFVPEVPVTSVNGQTGAVTIVVPTKTSQLENDSDYVRSVVPPIVQNVVCNDVDSATTLDTTITCEVGDLILAQIIVRSALTLPTGWTLLRTIPAVETSSNQTLSFAYKRATSTSETLTVTQATAARIYTNLVRLSNATSISYIQSCEKTNTGAASISSTKPVTSNMVIWGVSSVTWKTSSPYGDWMYSPSTLGYYSLPQSTKAPRLGTFVDSSGAGERTFTTPVDSSNGMMCGAVEIVGDEVARKGDIPTSLPVTYKKASGSLPTSGWTTLDEGWKQNTLPDKYWGAVTYGNGKFVAVRGQSTGAYSTGGIAWTEMTMPAGVGWQSVTYGNGKYVAVAYNTTTGAYSTDGISWTAMTLPASSSWQVTYGDGKFVAVGGGSDKGAYSTDAVSWTEFTLPANRNWHGVTYGNGKFVAVAYNSNKGAYSTDGINWTEFTLPATVDWNVTYGDGKFVAVARNTKTGAYSTDGISWATITLPASSDWFSVTYGNGKYVAVAESNDKGAYSTDCINWTSMSMPASRSWYGVTYGDGKFVAVAYDSANGAYWKAAAQVTYSISDTSITANTSVKMYLTDEGGVKAYSKAVGSIQVIRDSVPTNAIPYEYEVEQTSAEGLFEVINVYVPTKTSELTNDSGFAKTTEANTWTGVQTFSNSDGIKTDRVHNLDNNDAWYNFDGSNNRFGSPSRPTIIRTSEARPRAQVPSGETTVTKAIALLEDIPSAGAWVDVTGEATTLTQAGTYQFVTTAEKVQSIMYWDGTTSAVGIPAVALNVNNSSPEVITLTPVVDTDGRLIIHKETLIKENNAWVVKGSAIATGFKYRRIN